MPMFMLNGNQYGGNGGNYQVARMSKADYDALTDEQKNDGTLRIVVDTAGNSVNYMSAQVAGAKTDDTLTNLLNLDFASTTKNGVTITNNGDGTYTLSGTATAYTSFMVLLYSQGLKVKSGKYKLVGCPSGGGRTTYNMWICESSHGSDIDNPYFDLGNGVECTLEGAKGLHLEIRIGSGQTLPNLVFKPMLTPDLQATYDDFVGYTGGTGRLNSDVAEHQKEISRINSDLTDKTGIEIVRVTATSDTNGNIDLTAQSQLYGHDLSKIISIFPVLSSTYLVLVPYVYSPNNHKFVRVKNMNGFGDLTNTSATFDVVFSRG